MATRDYSSIYDIKNFFLNDIASKYFDIKEINDLNIGLLGYVTEIASNTAEDISNMVTFMQTERTPNTAVRPETIYSDAALYRVNDIFAKPATMSCLVMVREKEIIDNSILMDGVGHLTIDNNTLIDVDGIPFMFDNDIIIKTKLFRGENRYTVMYDNSVTNSLNTLNSPYLKSKIFSGPDGRYLAIMVDLHQVYKYTREETLINNKTINLPKIPVEFENMLAGFEVFYKAPDSDTYIQLEKVLKNSSPINKPFCYYTMTDSNEFEISFSSRDRYFIPEFNSEIKIEFYTTTGEAGNFKDYTGSLDKVNVSMRTTRFENNGNLKLIAIPQSESKNGANSLSFEELRVLVSEKFATVNTISTEKDLQLHFSNSANSTGANILFLKKRDDVFLRLFSAFSLYKDSKGEVIHTHTNNLNIRPEQMIHLEDDAISDIIKPGCIFKYRNPDSSSDDFTVEKIDDIGMGDDLSNIKETFLYTNPFLINVMTNPVTGVGIYLNSINNNFNMQYTFNNLDSQDQFICNSFTVKRNALIGDSSYEFEVKISASSELSFDITDKDNVFLDNLKTILTFEDKGEEIGYINLDFSSYSSENGIVTFKGYLDTDDCITLSEKIRCSDVKDITTGDIGTKLIPYLGSMCNVIVFGKSKKVNNHKYAHLEDFANYTLTNIYTSPEGKIDLVIPFSSIRCSVSYNDEVDGYSLNISELPMVSVEDMADDGKFKDLLLRLSDQYSFLEDTLSVLENNYSIDLKFMGTYGKSKMFVTENGDRLDKINCAVSFTIYPFASVDKDILEEKINLTIMNYFDSINIMGDRTIKISNLMQLLDAFPEVDYLKFNSINNYDSNIQVLINKTPDTSKMTSKDLLRFIPEYITIRPEDINIKIAYLDQ